MQINHENMDRTPVKDDLLSVYDYIIIGAGSCGCVLANRLSEDAGKTVVILEAGADDLENPDISIPSNTVKLQTTSYNWNFKSVPQKDAFKGFKDQVSVTPRGKGLGGSSTINHMIYMRGTPHDYDTWENMGCTGWSYRDVLPYFIKSESCLTRALLDNGFHGTDGPMLVTQGGYSPLADIFIEGGKELGYQETDCNGNDPIGFMKIQYNIGDGIRQSSAECYLRPVANRENLHIATNCHVTKIHVDNQIARGVEFLLKDQKQVIRARREILLCAGTIGSPQILMLSGIGPVEHLQALGVPIVADLPVGNNYHDHCGFNGIEFVIDKPYTFQPTEENVAKYMELRAGCLALNVPESTAFIRTDLQDPGNPNPDLQIISGSTLLGATENRFYRDNLGMTEEVWDAMYEGNVGKNGFTVTFNGTHPKSRGTVRLASTDPFAPPIIDPNSISHPDDMKVLIEGIKIILKLCETDSYKSIGTKFTARVLPGYEGTPFTDEYWEELIRTLTFNTYHPVGTCRMGRLREATTVVDPQLRVKGVDRLRVVDASIMPEISSANLHASCVMIAEKAADMIRGKKSTL